jgi:hypothetical protein
MAYNETPTIERNIMSKHIMTLEETINTVNIRKGKKEMKRIAIVTTATIAAVIAVAIASSKIETSDTEN